jgi:hypothetical protein
MLQVGATGIEEEEEEEKEGEGCCHTLVYLSMALQPFVGPWPLFQFLNPIHSRYDSLDGGSARLKAATYTQNNKNTE